MPVQEVVAAKHSARVGGEDQQQIELDRCEVERFPRARYRAFVRVDAEVAYLYNFGRPCGLRPAQYGLNARYEFRRVKGLRHIVVRPVLKAL